MKGRFVIDNKEYFLPDISYENFLDYMDWKGSSDQAYDSYLDRNNMKDMSDFDSETTGDIVLIFEQPHRGRVLKFKCIYDSDRDEYFDENEYFKEMDND